jgi:hypothetical protein
VLCSENRVSVLLGPLFAIAQFFYELKREHKLLLQLRPK